MGDRTAPQTQLAALGAHLSARHLSVDLTADGLEIEDPEARGCCAEPAHAHDVIRCRPRRDDGDSLWFFDGQGQPIAPADQIIDATVYVLGYLRRCPEEVAAEEGVKALRRGRM